MVKFLVTDAGCASVTLTPKLYVPAADGVPRMWPLELSVSPGGSVPDATDQE
jgi:hypothetical protein